MMNILNRNSTTINIANFWENYQLSKYNFEPDYQRKSDVWSPSKKSFLIDTILKNCPSPPSFLHQHIDEETGKQRNSLSLSAKKFKRRVFEIYAPIFKAMEWKAISKHCEIRLMVQPPRKVRSYSASTFPRFDIDNYPKLLIDSLKGSELLYKDDNIFVKEKIEFAEPIENGCVWLSCVFISETNWLDKKIDFDWLAGRVA